MTHPFTDHDVAALIQAARIMGKGGAGPLPALSEHLSLIANKAAAAIEAAAHSEPEWPLPPSDEFANPTTNIVTLPHITGRGTVPGPNLQPLLDEMFPTDRAETKADL